MGNRSMSRSICLVLVAASCAYALPSFPVNLTSSGAAPVCALDWFYCPKDPGCAGYSMSVKKVEVEVVGKSLSGGTQVQMTVTGVTTLESVPASGSYKVYNREGHNLGGGSLDGLTVSGGKFHFNVALTLDAASATAPIVDWGLDIFLDHGGSKEAMCIGVASAEYIEDQKKGSEGFVDYCKDNGDGTFTKETLNPAPTAKVDITWAKGSPCGPPPPPPKQCSLDWFYCPKDPGCSGYTMSVMNVTTDFDAKTIAAGDKVTTIVTGVTKMTSIPFQASYKIYDMAGNNAGSGAINAANLNLDDGKFTLTIASTLDATSVADGKVDWGLDVFLGAGGSDEAMCIGIANGKYIEESKASSEGFEAYCKDNHDGTFTKVAAYPDPTAPVKCELNPNL